MKTTTLAFSSFLSGLGLFALGMLGSPARGQDAPIALLTPEQAEILAHMHIVYSEGGPSGPTRTLVISGLNVQIVNGLGATNGLPGDPFSTDTSLVQTNGLGNLILGYDELGPGANERSGSHNLVLGTGHSYSNFGGVVSGSVNSIEGPHASALGGSQNTARGIYAVAVAGVVNDVSGTGAAALGGGFNLVSGDDAVVSGGFRSAASGVSAAVSGGYKAFASADGSSVHGGASNRAEGLFSSVSGGNGRVVTGIHDWAAGSIFEED